MREQFEKLPEIAWRIKSGQLFWNGHQNSYYGDNGYFASYVNGAWYAYQEQQKNIDESLAEISRAMNCCESIETECVLAEILEILR